MAARVDPAVLRVADAVGALIESWGFKRNMGRMWAVLYLEDHALTAADLGERLGLSTGAVSMLLAELVQWGAVKKDWVVGDRRDHYEAETSIWKMVSRVFRERELRWVETALGEFEGANAELAAEKPDKPDKPPRVGLPPASPVGRGAAPVVDARRALITARIAGLTQLAQVGAHLLKSILEGEAVDNLPLKTVGDLAKIVRDDS